MQRLPRLRIGGSEVGRKVILEKHPGAANFGTGDDAKLGATAELFGVTAEENCT